MNTFHKNSPPSLGFFLLMVVLCQQGLYMLPKIEYHLSHYIMRNMCRSMLIVEGVIEMLLIKVFARIFFFIIFTPF